MSNGEPLVLRAAMKPIPTTARPRDTVDIVSKEKVKATVERADVCAVPAAAIVAESSVAFVLAQALIVAVELVPHHRVAHRHARTRAVVDGVNVPGAHDPVLAQSEVDHLTSGGAGEDTHRASFVAVWNCHSSFIEVFGRRLNRSACGGVYAG